MEPDRLSATLPLVPGDRQTAIQDRRQWFNLVIEGKSILKITLLGTGTPAPSLERQGSGYLFEVGDDLIVMDHGPGAHHRLLESGHRAVDVSHAFFTHLHYDHCMDYARLVLQRWDLGADRIPDLQVYGPPPIKRMTDQLFGEDGVYGPDIRARIEHQSSVDLFEARGGKAPRKRPAPRVREMHAGDVIDGNGWKVTVGHATHVQPYLECLAFRLDGAEGSVCYTGDSGACDEIVELARGLRHAHSHEPLLQRNRAEPRATAPRAAITATTPRSRSAPA